MKSRLYSCKFKLGCNLNFKQWNSTLKNHKGEFLILEGSGIIDASIFIRSYYLYKIHILWNTKITSSKNSVARDIKTGNLISRHVTKELKG